MSPSDPGTPARRPLDGIKVVEAGIVLAGPFCGSLLADMGARVVKVERPDGGDPARLLGPAVDEVPLWWGVAARDKLCVTLDLKQAADKERFLALIEEADILVENYRPGALERLGLGWEALKARNPRLVMMSIAGFGQTGPYAGKPGFGKIAEGLSGIVPVTGEAGAMPLHVGFSLADTSAGLMGAMAVAMALYHRDCNGGGAVRIDIGLYEPLFRMMELQLALAEKTGAAPFRRGTNDPYGWGAPDAVGRRFVAIRCRDGAEVLVLVDEAAAPALASLAGGEPGDGADALAERLCDWAGCIPVDEVASALKAAGIEAARVHDGMSMAHDPYLRARGDVLWATLPDGKPVAVPGWIPRDASAASMHAFRPVALGADDAHVFGLPRK